MKTIRCIACENEVNAEMAKCPYCGTEMEPAEEEVLRQEMPEPADDPEPKVQSWYYEAGGKRNGPISLQECKQLLQDGLIDSHTLVWKSGFSDWMRICDSELNQLIEGPPPIPGGYMNNSLAWMLAFIPILGLSLGFLLPDSELWYIIMPILNIVLIVLDLNLLKRGGYAVSFWVWFWLVPVYLYKRATYLKQGRLHFVVWTTSFCLLILYPFLIDWIDKSAPKCDAAETIEAVKQTAREELIRQMNNDLTRDITFRLEAIRTTDFNEKTGKQACACNLIFISPNGESPLPITYTSELTDKGDKFIVTVYGLK
jgi:hypothetical protein